jgi:hypothetical protein
MTARPALFVALGQQRYLIERPWGDVPSEGGKVTDVVCDAGGHVFGCCVQTAMSTRRYRR